jgi:hypothetical protein
MLNISRRETGENSKKRDLLQREGRNGKDTAFTRQLGAAKGFGSKPLRPCTLHQRELI